MTAIRLRALFAAQGFATGLLLPFLVPLLADRGLAPATIGLVLGVSAAVTLVAYPAWGALADTSLGRAAVLRLSAACAVGAGVAVAASGDRVALVAAAVAAVSVGAAPWGPVSDAVALEALGPAARDYGRIRRWASAGWVVGALAGGAAYLVLGPAAPPLAFAAGAVAVGAVAGGRRSGHPREGATIRPARADRGEGRLRDIPAALRLSPVLLPFLAGLFLVSLGGSGAGSFLPLQIIDQGGGPLVVAAAAALPALVEIPVFSATAGFARRLGLRGLFVVGALVAALQYAVVAVAPEPWLVTAVRTADGAAYALRYAAIVLVVGACLPAAYRATGQSAAWLVAGGIAPILADPLAGAIYDRFGGTALFATAALVIVAGTAVVALVLDRPAFRADAAQPASRPPAAPPPGLATVPAAQPGSSAAQIEAGQEVGGADPAAGLD